MMMYFSYAKDEKAKEILHQKRTGKNIQKAQVKEPKNREIWGVRLGIQKEKRGLTKEGRHKGRFLKKNKLKNAKRRGEVKK